MHRFLAFMIFAVALACAMPASATPGPVDSSASGVYLGSDRVCRIVLSRWMTSWVQVDIRCQQFAGEQTASLTTVYAPNICPQGGAYMLNPWPPEVPREYLSLRSYDTVDQTLQVVKGMDQVAVTNGIGTAEAWYVIGFAPSPSPYTCGGTAQPRIDPHALARFCRQNPNVPACR